MNRSQITGKTIITGIFGFPVAHSLSPAMHNAAFTRLNMDWAYVPFEVHPSQISAAVKAVRALNIRGVNVTIPLKEAVLAHLDKIDPLARKIGSVNTIVNEKSKLTGYNTDGPGFLSDLNDNGFSQGGKNVLILGAGGAGRAIAHTLAWHGAKTVYIFDIDYAKAKNLASKVKHGKTVSTKVLKAAAKDSSLLVNATPIGMHSGDPLPLPKEALHKGLFVYDIIYNRPTELVTTAKHLGCKSCNGLGMLLNQGVLAFEKWANVKAPLQIMRLALIKTIRRK